MGFHTHQTIYRKSDRTLWCYDATKEYGQYTSDDVYISNCYGKIHSIRCDKVNPPASPIGLEEFAAIYDEFNEVIYGRPMKSSKNDPRLGSYYLPDITLSGYIDLTEEQRKSERDKIIDCLMRKFDFEIKRSAKCPRIVKSVLMGDYCPSRKPYIDEALEQYADHHFNFGKIFQPIFVFHGQPFVRMENYSFHVLEDVNVDQIEAFVQLAKEKSNVTNQA